MTDPAIILNRIQQRRKADDLIAFVESSLLELEKTGRQIFWRTIIEKAPYPPIADRTRRIHEELRNEGTKEMKSHHEPKTYSPRNDPEIDDTLEQVERIQELTDNCHWEDAEEAAETSKQIGETIDNTGRVSQKQQEALDNIEAAMKKWIRD